MKSANAEKSPTELSLDKRAENAIAVNDSQFSSVNMNALFEAAVKQGSAMEVIKELRLMESELQSRRAKAAFDEAMSAFQDECPVIVKQKAVKDTGGRSLYNYAPIEAIEVQIRPLLRKHGFSHTFDTDTNSIEGWVIAKCIVKHNGGHERTSSAKFPLGTKTAIMSATQQYSAALTFANRRALSNAYGLVLAGEDLDGAGGKSKPSNPNQMQPTDSNLKALAQELWTLLKPVRGEKKDWNEANQWLWKHEILDAAAEEHAPELSEEKFKEVIKRAKEKLPK